MGKSSLRRSHELGLVDLRVRRWGMERKDISCRGDSKC
jgi:hypothetical protein